MPGDVAIGATLIDLGERRLVLASASPRRRQLLASVGLEFDVVPADIDETAHIGESPSDYVARLSQEKASKVAGRRPEAIVIAADTTVGIDGQILEKPVDDVDARRMLALLGGRTHHVRTAVTVADARRAGSDTGSGRQITRVVTTRVTFVALGERAIDWYVATGEAWDKAGGYAIQGGAAAFVERVEGSVTNVIGLPLAETVAQLRALLR